jgi:YVTN family beta-propeller protein
LNRIYVDNDNNDENTVSAIEGSTSKVVANISTQTAPSGFMELSVNPTTHMVYMINQDSDIISVMKGKSNKLLAAVTFNVKPADSGFILCNNQKIIDNHIRYPVNTQLSCKANANEGFAFSAWSGDLPIALDNKSSYKSRPTICH